MALHSHRVFLAKSGIWADIVCLVWRKKQGVEGIVLDVGWYRTTIRSFEREIFNIPNSVFSRNVVLNITRKSREWRFFEFIGAFLPQLYVIFLDAFCTQVMPDSSFGQFKMVEGLQ